MKLDGTGLHRVTAGFESDWSPKGNDLVFNRDDENGIGDVWMAHTDGSGLRQLTHADTTEAFPTWSPEGSTIAFARIVAGGVFNIFALDPASGTEQLLLADSPPATYSVAYPIWQPLGSHEREPPAKRGGRAGHLAGRHASRVRRSAA
jgi:Tol biopolymer transport system component